MKQLFVKVQSSVGQSWADALEGVNGYLEKITEDPVEALKATKEHTQKVRMYTQISNLIKLSPNGDGNFTVSTAVPRPEGRGVKVVDMSKAFDALKPKNGSFDAIHYGFIFKEDSSLKDIDVIENSNFFGRDPSTDRFVDPFTREEVNAESNAFEAAIWFSIYKIKATDIYYMVVNPNLIAVSGNLRGTYEDAEYYHLNTRDGTFRENVFAPTVQGGLLITENLIIANNDTITIDTFGLSLLHSKSGVIDANNLPSKIEMSIVSSLPYTRDGSKITIDLANKSVGTVSYRWITGSFLDSSLAGNESLKYTFAIIKE